MKKKGDVEILSNKHIKEFLIQIAGENAIKVIEEITEPMNDEKIAQTCKIKVSDVRAILNKLHNYGLVEYERTRDKESGWYSYMWNVNLGNILKLMGEQKRRDAELLREMLNYEKTYVFFRCSKCGKKKKISKIPFETALEYKFKCLLCGSPLKYWNNIKEIRTLEKQLTKKTEEQ